METEMHMRQLQCLPNLSTHEFIISFQALTHLFNEDKEKKELAV